MQLVGRQAEREALQAALVEHRWVHVVGPPGSGKTGLVRAVLEEDALWCSATGAVSALGALADGLGLETEGAPLDVAVPRALAHRSRVVVDDASAAVASAVSVVVGDTPLVTLGTEPAGPPAHELAVGPLAEEDALALWSQATARLGHQADPQLAPAIVAQLDRLPGAIAWFASHAVWLGDAACLQRLREDRAGDSPLDAAVARSIAALAPADREALAKVACFVAGVPLDWVDAVVPIESVARLSRRGLVRREPGTPARLVANRSARRQARAAAIEEGSWDAIAKAHGERLCEVGGAPAVEIEAAAEAFEDDHPALAVRLSLALVPRALQRDPASLATRLARLAQAVPPSADLWLARAALERQRGHLGAARHCAEEALALDDGFRSRLALAHLDRQQSRPEAIDGYRAALAAAEATGERRDRCVGLGELGRMLQSVGRFREAIALHEQAISLAVALRWPEREALERSLHARATHRSGDVEGALPLHRRALAMHEAQEAAQLAGAEHGHMGYCLHERGELDAAEQAYRRSIAGLGRAGDPVLEAIERVMLARLLVDAGRPVEARLELSIVAEVTRAIAMPRLEQTRHLVAGFAALAAGEAAGAREHFSKAHAGRVRSEVGFEALTPAWRAWASRDQADAATLEAWLAESAAALAPPVDDHPGLQAALSVLGAATRGDTPPSFDEALLAVSRSLRAAVALTASPAAEGLVIEADGRAFHAPGIEPVDLRRRHAIRRVLVALAQARRDRPGAVVRFDALVEAGWPGEKMRAEAARKRLRTATWQLRKLGLDGVLMTGEGGYFLDPDQPIEVG